MEHRRPRLDRVPAAVLGGLAFATVAGLLGGIAWWLDLFSHFRVQYLAAAAVLAVVALWRRRPREATVAALLVAVNAAVVAPALPGIAAQATAHPGGRTIKVLTFNLHFRNGDYAEVADFLRREDADLVFLTEVAPGWRATLRDLAGRYPHQQVSPPYGDGKLGSSGLVVLSKRPWRAAEFRFPPEVARPAFFGRFDDGAGSVPVVAAHLKAPYTPRGHRMQVREVDFLARAIGAGPEPLLLLGDFNLTPWSGLWPRLAGSTGLKGAPGVTPTWPSPLAALGIPIDHVLGRGGIRVARAWTGPMLGSDHRPLIAEVRLPR